MGVPELVATTDFFGRGTPRAPKSASHCWSVSRSRSAGLAATWVVLRYGVTSPTTMTSQSKARRMSKLWSSTNFQHPQLVRVRSARIEALDYPNLGAQIG